MKHMKCMKEDLHAFHDLHGQSKGHVPLISLQNSSCYYRLDGAEGAPVVMLSHSLGLDHAMWDDLVFAWAVVRSVASNAIVLARDGQTLGIGAGQMSRVDAVRIAVDKAIELGHALEGAVLASDAFFPFADGPRVALEAGVRAIVQPGGSKRDDEVIAAVRESGATMVFTGRRHFRH